jgi:transcription elongation factor Elf1
MDKDHRAHEIETRRKLSELLQQQLQGFCCLVCGRDEFVQLDMPEQNLQTNLMLFEGDDPVGKKHSPLLTIACTHCGRIEQFAEQPLRKRLEAEEQA